MKPKAAASRGRYSTAGNVIQISARLLARARRASAEAHHQPPPLTVEILQRIAGPDIGDITPILLEFQQRGLLKIEDGVITLTPLEDLPLIADEDDREFTI